MIPPRLWLLLFLPLLILAGAAPAAQTWTTAWTPGTTAASRSAGDDSNDRDSKTNCYPCVRWDPGANSGNGGWEPDPEDSKPRDCPDDDADYTCKVCDGKGRPDKNKPNTTPVDAGEGCGCCKDGYKKCKWKPWAARTRSSISIDFNCDTAQTPEDAGKLMAKQIGNEMDKIGKDFAKEWDEQVVENEKKAYRASLKCLEDLLKQVQALGVSCP
jgi:hypothetical protein